MKTLKFQPHLIPSILSGEKKITWRLFDDKNLATGDEISFLDKATGSEFARAVITKVREKKLGDIQESDLGDHEKYATREALLDHYRQLYGEEVDLDSTAKIISFNLIK